MDDFSWGVVLAACAIVAVLIAYGLGVWTGVRMEARGRKILADKVAEEGRRNRGRMP